MVETSSCSPPTGGDLWIASSICHLIQGDVREDPPIERIPAVLLTDPKSSILEDDWLQGSNCRELTLEIST